MNKYLLAGTAAAAFTLVGGVANAQDFKVTISGEAKFEAYFASQKQNTNLRGVDFRSRFRLNVNPEATGLNGALVYGANVLLKNENGNSGTSYEAAYTYLKGAFGTVNLGDETTYNDGPGGITKPQDWISENDGQLGFVGGVGRDQTVQLGGQATRIRYDSPVISGFQLGLSYTPKGNSNGASDGWTFNRNKLTDVQDAYEIGAKFDSTDKTIADKFGSALLKASVSYAAAKNGVVGYEDQQAWQAGLNVGYAGFVIGGHYVSFGKSGLLKADQSKADRYSYGVGAQYTTGPFVVGAGYTYKQVDASDTVVGKYTTQSFTAGVKYNVAKGLDAFADYGYVKNKNSATGFNDNANVVMLGTVLGF